MPTKKNNCWFCFYGKAAKTKPNLAGALARAFLDVEELVLVESLGWGEYEPEEYGHEENFSLDIYPLGKVK